MGRLVDKSEWYLFDPTLDVRGDCPVLFDGEKELDRSDDDITVATRASVRLQKRWKELQYQEPVDRIAYRLHAVHLVIRLPLYNVLGDYSLCSSIQFLPCDVISSDTRPIWVGEYVIGSGNKSWDVADYDKSD